MKKLFSVCVEFDIPVAANSVEEANKVVKQEFDIIFRDLRFSECDVFPLELEECPEEYIDCLPYVSDYDEEDKVCQDYFEPKPIEDEESKKHIQKTLFE